MATGCLQLSQVQRIEEQATQMGRLPCTWHVLLLSGADLEVMGHEGQAHCQCMQVSVSFSQKRANLALCDYCQQHSQVWPCQDRAAYSVSFLPHNYFRYPKEKPTAQAVLEQKRAELRPLLNALRFVESSNR